MKHKYPMLFWAFDLNESLRTNFFQEYEDKPDYLLTLNNLIQDLTKNNCSGIQEKLRDTSDLNKFLSTLSELEIAKIMCDVGTEIKLLPDNYFPSASPDISCKVKGYSVFVEVDRLNENPYIYDLILNKLRNILKDYPYRVDVNLDEKLSVIELEHQQRKSQECIVEACLETFEKEIKTIHVDFPFTIKTQNITFVVNQINSVPGYPGIIQSKISDIKSHLGYLEYRLTKKAGKRQKFPPEHLASPFIVALDSEEYFVDEDDIEKLLYGSCCLTSLELQNERNKEWENTVDQKKSSESWKEIQKASTDGWLTFLYNKYLIPNNYTYRVNDGLFLSVPIMKHVSGILFQSKFDKFKYFPNPFCYSEINTPNLLNEFE